MDSPAALRSEVLPSALKKEEKHKIGEEEEKHKIGEEEEKHKIGEKEEKHKIGEEDEGEEDEGEEDEGEEEGWPAVTCPYWNLDEEEAVDEACREYQKQVWESEGFDFEMPDMENPYRYCRYCPVILEDSNISRGRITNRLVMEELVSDALETYHKQQQEYKVVCKRILRANDSPSTGLTYYITFEAEETSPSGQRVYRNYQVKAMKLGQNKGRIVFCRPEPEKKKNIDDILKRFGVND